MQKCRLVLTVPNLRQVPSVISQKSDITEGLDASWLEFIPV